MTLIWLIVWLLSETPEVSMWNNWAIALGVCAFIDIFCGGTSVVD